MSDNVVQFPVKFAPHQKRSPYKGPKINKKKRQIALNTILENFETQGLYGLIIIGLPYDRDIPYPYVTAGGERHEYKEALEGVRDTVKGVVLFDLEEEEE